MFSEYKYLIVNLVFSHLGFWSGDFFLIAPFPDHCLLYLHTLKVSCRLLFMQVRGSLFVFLKLKEKFSSLHVFNLYLK